MKSNEALVMKASTGLPSNTSFRERALVWRVLLGIEGDLEKRRQKYRLMRNARFDPPSGDNLCKNEGDSASQIRQIKLDVIRTRPERFEVLFKDQRLQNALTRVLFIWGASNMCCGYVQGINDISAPLMLVYLLGEYETRVSSPYRIIADDPQEEINHQMSVLAGMEDEECENAECDTYLSLQVILNQIQDSYIAGRPGIHDYTANLAAMVARINPELYEHMTNIKVKVDQFALRWMNCLFAREFGTAALLRLWDGIFAEGMPKLKGSVLYISFAFIQKFSDQILARDFEQTILLLQKLPEVSEDEIAALLSQAYLWRCLFEDSPQHLRMATPTSPASSSPV